MLKILRSDNSYLSSVACKSRWTDSAYIQVVACRLFGAKPLPKPMLTFFQLDLEEQTSERV